MRDDRPGPLLVVGAICGLTWAAALRGWMAQLVWPGGAYSWSTVVLVLLPGTAVGVLLGWALHLRRAGLRGPGWLVWSPALLAAALLDPSIARALVTTGEGAGALVVVATALAGGVALSRTGRSAARVLCAVVAALGLLLVLGMGSMAGPLTTARGAWVAVYGWSSVLLLCLASALPHPAARSRLGGASCAALGALCGLAWACALRGFMTAVAGPASEVGWAGTWGYVLLPGALAGGLLGWAEHLRRTGGRPGWRLLALSPLVMGAVLLPGLVRDPVTAFAGGLGAGAVVVPVLGVLGGHALCGRGSPWTRGPAGLVGVAALVVWPVMGTAVGGPGFALGTPHGLWAAVLYDGLLVTLALAAALPQRAVVVAAAGVERLDAPRPAAAV